MSRNNLTLIKEGNLFRVGPRCPECEWVGPTFRLNPFGPRWKWKSIIKAVVVVFWWHVLFSRRHTHWIWEQS